MIPAVLGTRTRLLPFWRCLLCGTYVEAEQRDQRTHKRKGSRGGALPIFGHAAVVPLAGIEQVAWGALAFLMFGMLGYLSALVLRTFSRTVIAGLLLLVALALASVMGVIIFPPDFLWQTMREALAWLPSVKEIIVELLRLQIDPILAIGYLLGLFVGLLGLRSGCSW